ncbi:MAG: hypothetical protein SF053_08025 [Bacteroidia bacterium]|nr:hypothetical protein [Bacteroidia bacterium]
MEAKECIYIWIDDDEAEAKSHAKLLNSKRISYIDSTITLVINVLRPISFESLISDISNMHYDGLILDLRLDSTVFRAPEFAQAVRSSAADRNRTIRLKDVPIVLTSSDIKIVESFSGDKVGKDLFDWRMLKEEIPDRYKFFAEKLVCLAKAYTETNVPYENPQKALSKLLGISDSELDVAVSSDFGTKDTFFPLHEYILFIERELIERPGLLVDEETFAARLGISLPTVKEDIIQTEEWNKIKGTFSNASYTGVLSCSFKRWWGQKVNEYFQELTNQSIVTIDARTRVALLKEKLNLQSIEVAKPIEGNRSYRYWSICEAQQEPLDPLEGLRITEPEPKSWQSHRYLSKKGRDTSSGYKFQVNPSDL